MAIEDSYLVHALCPGVLEQDYATRSLREALARVYGLQTARATQTVHALDADRDVAQTLSVKTGDAVLFIERVSLSQNNVPVEFLRIYYRGDRYSLSAELSA